MSMEVNKNTTFGEITNMFKNLIKESIREVLREDEFANKNVEDIKPTATRKEASDYLNISLPTLDTLIRTNQLEAFRIGRQVRITWKEIYRFRNDALVVTTNY